MSQNPARWFEIYVQDMERARAFYESVFQVKLEKINSVVPELFVFPQSFETYGASGALAKMDGVPAGGNSTLIYFGCADCAVEAKRITAAGGKILKEKTALGEFGFMVLAFDTEGNMFGLHSTQ